MSTVARILFAMHRVENLLSQLSVRDSASKHLTVATCAADDTLPAPLAGVTVLEVANWIAAPCAGALLADLGADVIKVEAPSGDSMRYTQRQPGWNRSGK
jgi:hypothetical protein